MFKLPNISKEFTRTFFDTYFHWRNFSILPAHSWCTNKSTVQKGQVARIFPGNFTKKFPLSYTYICTYVRACKNCIFTYCLLTTTKTYGFRVIAGNLYPRWRILPREKSRPSENQFRDSPKQTDFSQNSGYSKLFTVICMFVHMYV